MSKDFAERAKEIELNSRELFQAAPGPMGAYRDLMTKVSSDGVLDGNLKGDAGTMLLVEAANGGDGLENVPSPLFGDQKQQQVPLAGKVEAEEGFLLLQAFAADRGDDGGAGSARLARRIQNGIAVLVVNQCHDEFQSHSALPSIWRGPGARRLSLNIP